MIQIQKHFYELNKKAFTLIEVLISVSILVMIFVFLYSQFNLAQKSTKKTTQIEKHSLKRALVIELLYNDFISSKNLEPTSGKKYDKFINSFSSENSLYGIKTPFIKYAVISSNEGNDLVRLESHQSNIDISSANKDFYMDIIIKNIKNFKVLKQNEHIVFFLKSQEMKDIYFKFKRIYK